MKKVLLSIIAAAAVISANAQQRLVLYEEFSGENCGPCAANNPALMTLLNANSTKTVLLKYQSPIPSAGPIYLQNTVDVDARLDYYDVPFAPYGRQDGAQVGDGNIVNHTQAAIDAAYAIPTPFTITATHSWSSDGDSIFINVAVTSSGAFNGAQMKLRTALIEHLTFATAPGSNGETDFKNVMRAMYPSAAGTTIPNAWTVGMTQNFTISGPAPTFVDKVDPGTRVIVWLQDDANKVVAQAGITTHIPIASDIESNAMTVTPTGLQCAATSANFTPTVTIKNNATTTLTTADIYTRIDDGPYTFAQTWTGSLAAGATTTLTLPAVAVPAGGRRVIIDSIGYANGAAEINYGNNLSGAVANVYSTTANAIPFTEGFENGGEVPANWIMYDANNNGGNLMVTRVNNQNYGHGSSTYFFYHNNYQYPAGEVNFAIMPAADLSAGGNKAIDFWVAHATYNDAPVQQDKLEVVYSTNCGQSWTSVWSQQGAQLETAPASGNPFVPTTAAMWKQKSADISSVPAGAMIAFRATSDFGNNLFIDDVEIRMGTPLGVETFTANSASVSLFPNPAVEKATLSFVLAENSDVQVQVLDMTGRMVATVANGTMTKGQQTIDISTANYAAGMYNVMVKTQSGTVTQRMTVIK